MQILLNGYDLLNFKNGVCGIKVSKPQDCEALTKVCKALFTGVWDSETPFSMVTSEGETLDWNDTSADCYSLEYHKILYDKLRQHLNTQVLIANEIDLDEFSLKFESPETYKLRESKCNEHFTETAIYTETDDYGGIIMPKKHLDMLKSLSENPKFALAHEICCNNLRLDDLGVDQQMYNLISIAYGITSSVTLIIDDINYPIKSRMLDRVLSDLMATGKISNILCLTNRDILFYRTPYQDCLIS